jgi:cyclopropane fatty-acyl-phospholipid synthase-like methyltransferase
MRHLKFFKFMMDEIFPGGGLPSVALIEDHAARAGFAVNRAHPGPLGDGLAGQRGGCGRRSKG